MKYGRRANDDQHLTIRYIKGNSKIDMSDCLSLKCFCIETTNQKDKIDESINYAINSVTADFLEINPG